MIVFDATTLILLIEPTAKPPRDPSTGKPLEKCKERIEHLLETLSGAGAKVLIPTPVLAELLVRAGEAKNQYLTEITTNYAFRPTAFDTRAAVELAAILDGDLRTNRRLSDKETWAKLKFDRQVIAITKVHQAKGIYSDDEGLAKCARTNGLCVTHTWELPLPPVAAQGELPLHDPLGDTA